MGASKEKGSLWGKSLLVGSASGAEQSSREQKTQHKALSPPTTSRGRHFLGKLGWRSPSPPPPPSPPRPPSNEAERRNSIPDQLTSVSPAQLTSVSPAQSLADTAGVLARPHSSYSDSSTRQAHGPNLHNPPPTAAGGNVTTVLSVPLPTLVHTVYPTCL